MEVTRVHHLRYLTKLGPFLLVLYVLQALAYQHFAPPTLASDVNLFLGIGLSLLILSFYFYDHHHGIKFYRNYFEVSFNLLKIREEVLYQNITALEIKSERYQFGHIKVYLRDGTVTHLHHVDHPKKVVAFLEEKRTKVLL